MEPTPKDHSALWYENSYQFSYTKIHIVQSFCSSKLVKDNTISSVVPAPLTTSLCWSLHFPTIWYRQFMLFSIFLNWCQLRIEIRTHLLLSKDCCTKISLGFPSFLSLNLSTRSERYSWYLESIAPYNCVNKVKAQCTSHSTSLHVENS